MATEQLAQKPGTASPPVPEHDTMPLHGIDHVEFYVGNAAQAAYYFTHAFGFTETAYRGLETGSRERVSHVLEQGRIRLVFTGTLKGGDEIAAHHARHGDGVHKIALSVPDAAAAYEHAVAHGARGVVTPHWEEDEHGRVQLSAIETYGDTLHLFVHREGYEGLPARLRASRRGAPRPRRHAAHGHRPHRRERGARPHGGVGGLLRARLRHDRDAALHGRGDLHRVFGADVEGRDLGRRPGEVPDQRAAEGKRKSQIEEYIDFYNGAGAQHIALATRDIVRCVSELRGRGVEFLTIPESYYEEVLGRIGEIEEDVEDLRRLGILVDRDDEGYLLQIFTKPTGDRPTVFFEIIERHGARGFGEGNFKALFEAIEREQERRGTSSHALRLTRTGPAKASRAGAPERCFLTPAGGGGDGLRGLSGNESILLHLQSPCRLDQVGEFTPIQRDEWVPDAHVHRLADANPVEADGDPLSSRRLLMWNGDIEVSIAKPTAELDGFYRNGEGDEVIYVHRGAGVLRSVFGRVPFRERDYLVIPRGTTHTFELAEGEEQFWVCFHTPGEIETPNRYRNRYGQLLEHAPFSQRDFHPPAELETYDESGEFPVTVRVRDGYQEYVLDRHPFDVVGWDGYVFPYTFNADDFEPRAGRFHLPPPAHQTFQGPNFVICTFAPRMLDWDPEAVTLPYHHSNIQSEEVMFYAAGDYAARKGVDVGCLTLHPRVCRTARSPAPWRRLSARPPPTSWR